MTPVLLLCCAMLVGCLGDKLNNVNFPKSKRDFLEAKDLLNSKLRNVSPDFMRKDLHYLVLLGSVYRTARMGPTPLDTKVNSRHLLYVLNKEVPDLLEKPKLEATKMLNMVNDTEKKLLPLLDLMDALCDSILADLECNKLVKATVRESPDLLKLVPLLKSGAKLSRNYLDVEARLDEVAEKREQLPYLLDNLQSAVDSANLVRRHLVNLRGLQTLKY